MSDYNLRWMFQQADAIDYQEGLLAYTRYNLVMRELSDFYGVPFSRVVAAFAALSPNNDYSNNLRSVATLLNGFNQQIPFEQLSTSAYGHCAARAWSYINGAPFDARGLKIRNFYHNILDPSDNRFVTVDGHIHAAWLGRELTMKEAIVKNKSHYHEIAHTIKQLAFEQFILPNQYQAIIWFTRKRVLNIKYDPQHDLFFQDDAWKTKRVISEIKPFELKNAAVA